nr:unnamed protein product [Callosobruchus analis]
MTDAVPDVTNKDLYALMQQEVIYAEIQKIKDEFEKISSDLKSENVNLKKEVVELKNKINVVERRNKKYNIVTYGLKEENNLKDIEYLLHVFNEKLEVKCGFDDFRDFFRIGVNKGATPRPFVVETLNYPLKAAILENSKKLKGTGISITQDYTKSDYEDQKVLVSHLKQARSFGIPASLKKQKLHIENKILTAEDLRKGAIVEIVEKRKNEEDQKENSDPKPDTDFRQIIETYGDALKILTDGLKNGKWSWVCLFMSQRVPLVDTTFSC